MSNSEFVQGRLKVLAMLSPAIAALLYFAVAGNAPLAIAAALATVALSFVIPLNTKAEVALPVTNPEAEDQLAAIGRAQAMIEFELNGTILNANENFLRVMGYSLEEIRGKHHSMFVEPQFAASPEYSSFWDSLARGEASTSEFKRLAKGGRDVWLRASYAPVIGANGKPYKVIKSAVDITQSKEVAVIKDGQITAIDRSQAVIEFELDGTIVTANQNFLDAMGYRLDEIQGKHHSIFVEPTEAATAEYRNFWGRLAQGDFFSEEFKRISKDGREVWIQASYNPIFDLHGRPVKVVKYATDITEQKVKSVDMRGQVEAISRAQAVIEFEMDGTVITANQNFLDVVGYRLEEVQGRHHSIFVDKDYAASAEYRQFWAQLGHGDYFTDEYVRLAKDGTRVRIQASYNPILDADGKPYKVVKFATDVTAAANEAARNRVLRQAIATVSSNCLVADSDFDIMYMNPSAEALFRASEADIRQELPKFDASNLLGMNIDEFHRDPSHQRRMLSSLTRPHTTQLSLGSKTFKIVASPLKKNGESLGAVLEWYDRTQELEVENEVQGVVQSALGGDLSRRISVDGKTGFFETLSKGVNQLVGISEQVLSEAITVLSAMAQGDLSKTMSGDYEGSYQTLKEDANATVAKLTEVVSSIQTAAGSVKTGADEISQGNSDLSQRTEEQASSLEETASSMEEMTSTVKQNADNAGQANQLAKAAREQAEAGGNVVGQAVVAMAEINDSSKKISDIIGVIDEIAFQTNLLALNASVEAARAGDQGRGFAVVASEVRNLAGRSATAAKEIKDLIQDSGAKVDEGSRLVNESGETLKEIVNGVKKVTDIVGEIAAASQEQSDGIEEVNKAITQMDELTQQNAALVEEAAAASESLGEQADGLNTMMQFFRVDGSSAASLPSHAQPPAGMQERRSASRPWSAPAASTPAAQPAAPAPRAAASGGGNDVEWEEF